MTVLVALALGAVGVETGLGGYSSGGGGGSNGYGGSGGSSGGGYGGYGGGSGDAEAPKLSVRAGALQARKRVLRRGLALGVKCSEACKVQATVSVNSQAAKRGRMRPGTVLGHSRATLATWWDKLPVRLNGRGRKAVKRSRAVAVTVTIVARDAEGNRSAPVKRTIVIS